MFGDEPFATTPFAAEEDSEAQEVEAVIEEPVLFAGVVTNQLVEF